MKFKIEMTYFRNNADIFILSYSFSYLLNVFLNSFNSVTNIMHVCLVDYWISRFSLVTIYPPSPVLCSIIFRFVRQRRCGAQWRSPCGFSRGRLVASRHGKSTTFIGHRSGFRTGSRMFGTYDFKLHSSGGRVAPLYWWTQKRMVGWVKQNA